MSDTSLITRSTVKAQDLRALIEDPCRGTFSLVGSAGNLSEITDTPEPSALLGGAITIDTEHGTLLVGTDEELLVSERHTNTLTPDSRRQNTHWFLSWSIDDVEFSETPREAAAAVWRDVFGRDSVSDGDACVFVVEEMQTHETVTVDLAEHLDD